MKQISMGGGLQQGVLINPCNAGFFRIDFTDAPGSGFNDNADESKTYDDVTTCLQGGIVLRHTNDGSVTSETSGSIKKQSVALFKPYFVPNPAKQNATLFYQLDNSKDGILYISNYLGEVLMKQALKANDNSVSISTGSLANGIYHFKVISNGDEIGNGKFAVIK